jgi:formylglycine-generating enzyme required for sulfatase activity
MAIAMASASSCAPARRAPTAPVAPPSNPPHTTSSQRSADARASDAAIGRDTDAATHTAPVASNTPLPEVEPGMLPVPGGTFTMGSDNEGEMDERPAHRVTLAPYLLDITEVTNLAYLECVHAGVCRPCASLDGSKLTHGLTRNFHLPDHPVVGVSWSDAKTYCGWRGKRLPREAEWERAVRGNDDRRYPWGNAPPDPHRHGCFGGHPTTEPVGSYPEGRGPFGHLDLVGNVWEWQEDEYDPYAYRRAGASKGLPGSCTEILAALAELRAAHKQGFTGSNPIPVTCEHSLRGGAYNYRPDGLRASNRVHHPGEFRIAVAGFRCAKSLDPGESSDRP